MNFGILKEAIDEKLTSYIEESNNNGINKILSLIKEDKAISTQWQVYNDVENFKTNSDFVAGKFLSEKFDLIAAFKKEELTEKNKQLADKLGIDYSRVTNKKLNKLDELFFGTTDGKYSKMEKLITQLKVENNINEDLGIDFESLNSDLKKAISENHNNNEQLFSTVKDLAIKFIDSEINESKDVDIKNKLVDTKLKIVNMSPSIQNTKDLINLQN